MICLFVFKGEICFERETETSFEFAAVLICSLDQATNFLRTSYERQCFRIITAEPVVKFGSLRFLDPSDSRCCRALKNS